MQGYEELLKRYGRPYTCSVDLGPNTYLARSTTRVAEVCLVLKRSRDRYLTQTKDFYPKGVYRLLTGGIDPGETILQALMREAWEETGLSVEVKGYLAHITYRHNGGSLFHNDDGSWFHSHCFLLEAGGEPSPQDESERISDFASSSKAGLWQIADALEALPEQASKDLGATWRDWGRFRAVAHRVVAEVL